MSETAFADVSFTDAQTAAWGGAVCTAAMLAPMSSLGKARLAAIEVLNPAVLAQCVSRGENPLQRLDALRERAGGTPLRAAVNLLPDHGRCDVMVGDVIKAWMQLLARHGVAEALIVDPLLNIARFAEALRFARDSGLVAIAALPYAEDATRDDAYYTDRAIELVAAGAKRVMLRDEAGLLDVDRIATLIPALRAALGSIPLDLHTRCHTGLGPQVALEAVRLKVDRIDAALACVANGASAPSLSLLLRSAARLGLAVRTPASDAAAEAQARLAAVGEQEAYAQSLPWAFELAPYIHQLPGEVAAESTAALRARRIDAHAYAHECEHIRRELGSPPMLQPFARAIARQALAHCSGEPRYATLEPMLRRMLQGVYPELQAAREDLRQRVGISAGPRVPQTAPDDESALLALVAGIEPAAAPPWRELQYEILTPEDALARGLLARWAAYAELSVTGPGIAVRLAH
jgi:oxaloacetate decarboxylase (Na+ extruding) subunit alpha